jgi:signal transduction histidine kinase
MRHPQYHVLVTSGFILAITLLIVIGLLGYRSMKKTIISDKWERHSDFILLSLQKLLTLIIDAETGQRGFIITGEQIYLEPYYRSLNLIARQQDTLAVLAGNDTLLSRRLTGIDSLIRMRLNLLQKVIHARQTQGLEGSRRLILSGMGKAVQDDIRSKIAAAQNEEAAQLRQLSVEKARELKNTFVVLTIGSTLSLFLLILIFLLLRKEISRHQASEKALQKTSSDLERSNKDLEQFSYFVSHDLQEPLRAVVGFLSYLKRDIASLSEEAQDDINEAVAGARRMQNLIQGLLAYSRVGRKGAPFVPVDLKEAVNDAMANLGAAIAESNAQIAVEELPVVMADKTQMSLLFQNLIGNAIKYRGRKQPIIRVWARRGDRQWIISVSDNGIGFDPIFSDKIFQIFQRLQTREEYTGTGIGLALCKRIVEWHGGRIWVESKPGEGSTFLFTLPQRGEM